MRAEQQINQYIKDYENGNLKISEGGNFQDFLNRLIQFFQSVGSLWRGENMYFVIGREKATGKYYLNTEDKTETEKEAETLTGLVKIDDFEDEYDYFVCEVFTTEREVKLNF